MYNNIHILIIHRYLVCHTVSTHPLITMTSSALINTRADYVTPRHVTEC